MSDTELQTLRRRGKLTQLSPGAYIDLPRYQHLGPDDQYRARIRAVAARSPDLVVSHASAAALHGLPLYGVDLSRVHLTRPGHGGNRLTGHRWVHAGSLPETAVVSLDGSRATGVARTIIDLARSESVAAAVVTGDAALHHGMVTGADLTTALDGAYRHNGRPKAQRALGLLDGRAESPGESRLRIQLRRVPLPPPELQVDIFDEGGRFVGRVDAAYLDHGVLIEFDGMVKYGAMLRPGQTTRDAVIQEKLREQRLSELGWLVLRFVWAELRDPARVAERIYRA